MTAEAGIVDANGRGLGVVAADLDDDGLVDLFVANDTTANYLWHNLGGMKFEEAGIASGVACNADGAFQAGMGTACGDLDGDRLPDLFVTNFYGESTTFFRNLGPGCFADQTAAVGLAAPSRYLLGFGIALFDANNDGRLDLATTNGHVNDDRPDYPYEMPALLMMGGDDGRLTDVTQVRGEPWTVPRIGRGLAVGRPRQRRPHRPGVGARRTRPSSSSTTRPAGRPRRELPAWREPGPTATASARSSRSRPAAGAAAPGVTAAAAFSRPPTLASTSAWGTTASRRSRSAGRPVASIASRTWRSTAATGCGRETQRQPCYRVSPATDPRPEGCAQVATCRAANAQEEAMDNIKLNEGRES